MWLSQPNAICIGKENCVNWQVESSKCYLHNKWRSVNLKLVHVSAILSSVFMDESLNDR